MMLVQDFLRSFGDSQVALAELEKQFAIKARQYPEDNMVLLDYNQIDSPKTHPFVIECRSLILSLDKFDLISMKFPRFFNYGEAPELVADFDYSQAVVLEKADGSLIGVYFNPHTMRWEISTRGMAKAEGEHIMGGTFRQRVLAAFGYASEVEFQKMFSQIADAEYTYIYEYTSPENRIVTKYEADEMVLIGIARKSFNPKQECGIGLDWETMVYEATIQQEAELNVRLPKRFNATVDVQQIVEMVNSFANLEEGVVIWEEKTNRRVKLKSRTYLAAHRLRGENAVPTRKNMLEVVLEGEIDELLAIFPEFQKYADPVIRDVDALEFAIQETWERVKDIQEQKEFALAIKDQGMMTKVLFETRKKGGDPLRMFHSMALPTKMKIVGI